MSLASDLLEKMKKKGQLKIKPEPLPVENPGEPSEDQGADDRQPEQPKPETPGSLFNKPIAIESRHLDGAVVYLVQDEIMASEAEKQGLIAFTTEEIRVMGALERSMNREQWVSHLKAVYQTKKVFEGSRVIR